MIWIPNEEEAWVPVQVLSSDAKSVSVRMKNGNDAKVPGPVTKYDAISPGSLEEVCENLVDLESFSEGIILHHTKRRFTDNIIYTFVGSILIALNPYKSINIYGPEVIDRIYTLTKQNETVPPHVFSIGAAAVRNMRQDSKDQSVLISGESGAGKTEATKKILQFISTVCGSTASRVGASIENQILDSNPLLESFGNAKTIRNNNSSRFGKYMEVNFDKKNNVKGCNIKAYLLEKSRVVKQGPNERNYHVFYMLLEGASKDMRSTLSLKAPTEFHYLNQSGCVEVERRSEQREYDEMQFAMNSLAFDFTTQQHIYQCLAGVLHLGNLSFVPSREVENGSQVAGRKDCLLVGRLLGVDPEGLERALCFKELLLGSEVTSVPLTVEKAADQRDTLSKYVYGKVFDYIVNKVNSSLYRGNPGRNIGVLDIFGFEVFKLNSFEQLCINYCNERLQTFFNEVIFEGEMKTYQAEGLPCDDISFQDNIGCVRLIDLKGAGIFGYLDEEIVVPQGSDEKFVSKLNSIFDEGAKTKSVYFGRCRRSPLEFTVRHFAGEVTYEATDFMEKNKDALAEGLVAQMQKSTISMLHAQEEKVEEPAAGGKGGGGGAKKKSSKMTLAAKFKLDLDNLMTTLRSTVPHFIRCVKPNNDQKADLFDASLALNQLKYSGLFEAIRIRKSGYAVRMSNEVFVKRYKHCVLTIPASTKQDTKEHCNALLLELTKMLPEDEVVVAKGRGGPAAPIAAPSDANQRPWVVGTTRVFIRSQRFKYKLDALRDKLSSNCAIPLQKIVRGFLMRCRFAALVGDTRKEREASRHLEADERKLMALADASSMQFDVLFRNDFTLQRKLAEAKNERHRVETAKLLARKTTAIVKLQKIVRGRLGRTAGRIFMCEKMFEMALTRRDEVKLRRAILMPSVLGVTSRLIKVYQHSAKNLVLEVLSEAYVVNQLLEAVTIGSVEILRDAIRLAEESHMPYLTPLRQARTKLESVLLLKSTLSAMHGVLSKCVTVPKLLAQVDFLQYQVEEATSLGLAGEVQVQQAAFRMSKIRNLIALRDRIRFAVEICSPSKMKGAMAERSKLLRIYGEELCAEEAAAVEGMFRMLNYQQSVEVLGAVDEEDRDLGDPVTLANINSFDVGGGETGGGPVHEYSDVFLPPFVRKPLDDMRSVQSEAEMHAAIDSFVRLVPDEAKRKFYVRIFKWVVAFATWKYARISGGHRESPAQKIGVACSALEQLKRSMAQQSLGSTQQTGRDGGEKQTPVKSSSASKTTTPVSTAKTLGTSSSRLSSATKTLSASRSAAAREEDGAPAAATPSTMPFSQRQSKSQVAVHEMLKKGKKHNYSQFHSQTDRALAESIGDYDKFASRLKPASTF